MDSTSSHYSGDPQLCSGFLLQCSLHIEMNPNRYPTDRAKIAYIISLLAGPALQWADALWQQGGTVTQSYPQFTRHFQDVFGISLGDATVQERLFRLRQGRTSITEHVLQFRTLAASSGWNEAALLTHFRMSLEPSLRLQLTAQDDSLGLEKFIQLAIQIAHRRESCLRDLPPVAATSAAEDVEPMQVNSMRLTPAERRRRLTNGLSLLWPG